MHDHAKHVQAMHTNVVQAHAVHTHAVHSVFCFVKISADMPAATITLKQVLQDWQQQAN